MKAELIVFEEFVNFNLQNFLLKYSELKCVRKEASVLVLESIT